MQIGAFSPSAGIKSNIQNNAQAFKSGFIKVTDTKSSSQEPKDINLDNINYTFIPTGSQCTNNTHTGIAMRDNQVVFVSQTPEQIEGAMKATGHFIDLTT